MWIAGTIGCDRLGWARADGAVSLGLEDGEVDQIGEHVLASGLDLIAQRAQAPQHVIIGQRHVT